MRTVTGLFDDYADASSAVSELEALGVPSSDISIVSNNADRRHEESNAAEGAGTGAGIGAVVGGGVGAGSVATGAAAGVVAVGRVSAGGVVSGALTDAGAGWAGVVAGLRANHRPPPSASTATTPAPM